MFRAEGALGDKAPRRSCGGLEVGFDEGPMFGLAFDGVADGVRTPDLTDGASVYSPSPLRQVA